ncbi:hypothetical protein OU995_09750 [Roseateles sp. SL47]|uniref:hypothetical protein n=1 Tax=Roseateles sp. SL47 TaxID=2995138 RepID=UPI002271FC6F|nr:hypothetical protein [Roseateles sp. SL47]WAC74952.1 hypothetical protein OU995_09750 [Roseateles sp. SL47]
MTTAVAALAFGVFPQLSQAEDPYDWSTTSAHVVTMELTYMPASLMFAIDTNVGSCGAGTMLTWKGSGADETARRANMNAVLAAMLAAKVSGTPVRVFGKTAGCEVKFVYFG